IRTGGFEVTFPWRLCWGLKLLRILPRPFCRWVISTATCWKARPLNFDRKPPSE
ncbi:MAG: oxidoreductase, partial [Mesorhizobium sp.]